jgi:hypothetical protein
MRHKYGRGGIWRSLLGSYQGVLSQALTVGALLGIAGGIILFTVDEADDRLNLIIIGVLAGGFIMFLFQAFSWATSSPGAVAAWTCSSSRRYTRRECNLLDGDAAGHPGDIAGGLFMFVALAPGKGALKGALLGL